MCMRVCVWSVALYFLKPKRMVKYRIVEMGWRRTSEEQRHHLHQREHVFPFLSTWTWTPAVSLCDSHPGHVSHSYSRLQSVIQIWIWYKVTEQSHFLYLRDFRPGGTWVSLSFSLHVMSLPVETHQTQDIKATSETSKVGRVTLRELVCSAKAHQIHCCNFMLHSDAISTWESTAWCN